jgi:toxin ParE1/3/4
MTSRLEITPEAERDIYAIVANIHQQDCLATARHTLSEIKKQLNTLAEYPDSGRAGGADGTREVVMAGLPYIAVYEMNKSLVTIVRVLYGADERRQRKRELGK